MNDKKITISRSEYKEAVAKVITNEVNDPKLEGMGKLLIPMVGMIFAEKIGNLLFQDETNNTPADGNQ